MRRLSYLRRIRAAGLHNYRPRNVQRKRQTCPDSFLCPITITEVNTQKAEMRPGLRCHRVRGTKKCPNATVNAHHQNTLSMKGKCTYKTPLAVIEYNNQNLSNFVVNYTQISKSSGVFALSLIDKTHTLVTISHPQLVVVNLLADRQKANKIRPKLSRPDHHIGIPQNDIL